MDARFRTVNGLQWPAHDTECADVVFSTFAQDAPKAMKKCEQHRTVLQAGGNAGVWAIAFSEHFSHVVTCEPHPLNYECLKMNCAPYKNITALPYALGEERGVGYLTESKGNSGAHQVEFRPGEIGQFLIKTIDGLGFGPYDLIYLDVEGFELQAFKGAFHTIERDHPVLCFEDKGLSEKYGIPQGAVERYLAEVHNYRVVDRFHRDVLMIR